MTPVVVDASVTAAWCFEDEETEYARELLRGSKHITFQAPAVWPLEMANVLLVNERRKRITVAGTARFVKLLTELAIQVDRAPSMQPFGVGAPDRHTARHTGCSSTHRSNGCRCPDTYNN